MKMCKKVFNFKPFSTELGPITIILIHFIGFSSISAPISFSDSGVQLKKGSTLINRDWANGAPVAEWVKRWPTDLAVPSSSPARGEIFSTVNGIPLHTAFHYHSPIVLI